MTRRTAILLVAILALIGWIVYQRFFTFITNREPRGTNIIAFGDSLTFGMGVPPHLTWVGLLEKQFGVPIINAGVNGNTTSDALARLQKEVLDRDPKVVIVELGGNDLLKRIPASEIEKNLDEIVRRIQDQGSAVVLLGADAPLGVGGLSGTVKKLGKKYNTAYCPNIMKGILGHTSMLLTTDQIHPNSKGHALIAKRVGKILHREIPSVFH